MITLWLAGGVFPSSETAGRELQAAQGSFVVPLKPFAPFPTMLYVHEDDLRTQGELDFCQLGTVWEGGTSTEKIESLRQIGL